jgi:hypothetical protein
MILNSAVSPTTGSSAHELMYGMELENPIMLLDPQQRGIWQNFQCRKEARELIKPAAMDGKKTYVKSHKWICFAPAGEVLLRLNRRYILPLDRSKRLSPKLH